MDLQRSEAQNLIIANVRRFIREEIRPLEDELDPDAYSLPDAERERLIAMVKEMGLYQMDLPQEYGGPGVDTITRTLVAEELSQHRAGLYAPAYGVFGSGPPGQLYSANEEQKERYMRPIMEGELIPCSGITESNAGSNPREMQTRAVTDGDEYVVNGTKMWISNGTIAA